MCPDLPMPVTTTRPRHARQMRQACANSGPSLGVSASTARASMPRARRAEASSCSSSACGAEPAVAAGCGSMHVIIGVAGATPCNIASMDPEEVARLIRAGLPGAQVQVESADGTHFSARVITREFAQLRSLARHQLVYRTLGERMGREIHALSIEALTPEESGQ